jgi:hypothetical protein
MAEIKNNWKLIRCILYSCESKNDIDNYINILEDKTGRNELIKVLRAVSSTLGSQNSSVSKKILQNNDFEPLLVDMLVDFFRERLSMNNRQIEEWLVERFQIKQRVGKNSLRDYFKTIIQRSPKGIEEKILLQASKEFTLRLAAIEILGYFGDGLDALRNGDYNASIQGR